MKRTSLRNSAFRISLLATLLVCPWAFSQQRQIDYTEPGAVPVRVFASAEMLAYEKQSVEYSGLSKVTAVDNSPALYYSKTDFWPQGAWGRGYATEVTAAQFYEQIPGKRPQFYSAHPLVRVAQSFLTAHIYDYLSGINREANLVKINQGIDFLLEEQLADGAFRWWKRRQTQINMSSSDYPDSKGDTVKLNKAEDYETCYALNALCTYYSSELVYRRQEVLEAIKKAERTLCTVSDFRINTNNNVRGLALWAIAGSYAITGNQLALTKLRDICKNLLSEQDSDGQWRTGGLDEVNYNGTDYLTFHDQKIAYHFFILRGLASAMEVLPKSLLRKKAVNGVKRAVDHLVNQRLSAENKGFLYVYDLMKDVKTRELVTVTSPSWYEFNDPSTAMETFITIYRYALKSGDFTDDERATYFNLSNLAAKWISPQRDNFRPAAMYHYAILRAGADGK